MNRDIVRRFATTAAIAAGLPAAGGIKPQLVTDFGVPMPPLIVTIGESIYPEPPLESEIELTP